jgi:perosamine synthetase
LTNHSGNDTPAVNIPLCVPQIEGNEWEYLKQCLDTNWVSSAGKFVTKFEEDLADYVGANRGVAVTNGTAALHIALLVAGVEPDDEVLVSTLTFIAPANAIRYAGAWPVFIDADPEYWQMDPECLREFLDERCEFRDGTLLNKSTGRRVKAVIPVHILGHPCDMDPIMESARRYGLTVIEDATESLGARYKGQMVGNIGDISCFSFNGNKLITTGGGGMVVTNDQKWADRANYLTNQAKDDPLEYVHGEVGYNYRLTNIQAAIGCAQIERIDHYIQAKLATAATYTEYLEGLPGITPMTQAPWAESVFWMFTALVDEDRYGMDSRQLLRALDQQGIQTRPLWQPCDESPAHAGSESQINGSAREIHRQALSLPCSVGLPHEDQERVLRAITTLGK